MSEKKKPVIDLEDDFFGCLLNCAVRYACGRMSYMPSLVVDEITPLLPYLSDKTLWCFDQDITDARYNGGYGDPQIDEPLWMRFHNAVKVERKKRGHEPYVDWHPHDYPTWANPNSKYETVRIRVDSELLREVEKILNDQYYSLEQAIHLFFRWCILFPNMSGRTILEWKKQQDTSEGRE